jgi:hypothetical protein
VGVRAEEKRNEEESLYKGQGHFSVFGTPTKGY